MTDRELLELAAKAAGIDLKPMVIKPVPPNDGDGFIGYMTNVDQWPRGWFNPLTDDGDALRLAVKLNIQVTPGTYNPEEFSAFKAAGGEAHEFRHFQQDEFAATRRAITRAAAAMGAKDE